LKRFVECDLGDLGVGKLLTLDNDRRAEEDATLLVNDKRQVITEGAELVRMGPRPA
jgi:hypothetical protein